MRVLVVEDNEDVLGALRMGLRASYVVDAARTGDEGLQLAEMNEYDAILLDLQLPDIDGLQVCKELRKEGLATPIIVLTAKSAVGDKVSLLDAGANDYITKPFSIEELRARIRAVLRTQDSSSVDAVIAAGSLMLNTATREVTRGQTSITLRRKEFDLLEYLMRNNARIVSRQMILDHVWDMNDTIWTNAIDVHIKYLRDKIDRPFGLETIKTVHGVGYRLDPAGEELQVAS